jgi:hypothetical protein
MKTSQRHGPPIKHQKWIQCYLSVLRLSCEIALKTQPPTPVKDANASAVSMSAASKKLFTHSVSFDGERGCALLFTL